MSSPERRKKPGSGAAARIAITRKWEAGEMDDLIRMDKMPATDIARQYFLYGKGDGERILDVGTLAEMVGLHPSTIRNHIKSWIAESEIILASSSDMGSQFLLSAVTLKAHEQDIAFIRTRMDEVKTEIDTLDDIVDRLESIVDRVLDVASKCEDLKDFDPNNIVNLVDSYLKTSLRKKNLMSTLLELKRVWDAKAGLDSHLDIAVTSAKERAKGKVRLEIRELERLADAGSAGKNVTPKKVSNSIFKRG